MSYLPVDIATLQSDLLAVLSRIRRSMDDDEDRAFSTDMLQSVLERMEPLGVELQESRMNKVKAPTEMQNGTPDIILPVALPEEIDGPRQRLLMYRALNGGLVSPMTNGYKTIRMSGRQEAYLCKQIFMVDMNPFPAKQVEQLFQTHNLSASISRLADNRGGKPKGWERIDKVLAG